MGKYLILLFYFTISFPISAQNWAEIGKFNWGLSTFYVDSISDELYMGGNFCFYNSDTLVGLAKWDGHNMSTLGCGVEWDCITTGLSGYTSPVNGIIRYNNNVFATGGFDKAGNKIVNGLAVWDGSNWNNFNTGLKANGTMGIGLGLKIINDTLYIYGIFDSIAGIRANSLAKYDGANWCAVNNLPSINIISQQHPNFIFDIEYYKNELYVCGNFYNSTNDIYNIIKWNGVSWVSVGNGIRGNMINLNKMLVFRDKLIIAGMFTKDQFVGNPGDYISSWDGTQWCDLGGGMDDIVKDIKVHDDTLYACGTFKHAGGIAADGIARWDGTKWCGFGTTFDNAVIALEFFRDTLYIGGGFWTINGDSILRFAKWTGGNYVDTCGNTTSIAVLNKGENNFNIFPNPATENISIETSDITKEQTITIYNLQGQLLMQIKMYQPKTELNISSLAKGVYIIKFSSADGIAVRKFIKH